MAENEFDDVLGGDKKLEDQPPSVPIISSAADYPTVFADGCIFTTRVGPTVRMTFVEQVIEAVDATYPGPKTRHVGTLVLPVEGFRHMMRYFEEIKSSILPEATDGW